MSIFKAYDIRGLYPGELDEEMAYRIGHSLVRFLKAKTLVVGRDMRLSGERLCRSVTEGVRDAGADVIDLGVITTPMSYFGVGSLQADGSLMTTASHNPAAYNGFKLCREEARALSSDSGIAELETMVNVAPVKVARRGSRTTRDLWPAYKKHVLAFADGIRPAKVVLDTGNGMGGKYFPELLGALGMKVVVLYPELDGRFPNHEANPLKDENIAELKTAVVREKAVMGIALDGDADRCAFVSERGERIPCDLVTVLLAREMLRKSPGRAVVYDLRSSWVVPEEISRAGGKPLRERVGHSFMKATLRKQAGVFGGELSGHYYFRDNYYADSAAIAVVAMLNMLSRAGKPLSEEVAPLRRYFPSGEINFPVADKEARMEALVKRFPGATLDRLDGVTLTFPDWWCNVRPSNTEPTLRLNLEAKSVAGLEARLREIKEVLGKPE